MRQLVLNLPQHDEALPRRGYIIVKYLDHHVCKSGTTSAPVATLFDSTQTEDSRSRLSIHIRLPV